MESIQNQGQTISSATGPHLSLANTRHKVAPTF